MKCLLLIISFLLVVLPVSAQHNVKVFAEKENGATILYAQNDEFCPVSIELTLEMENMDVNNYGNGIFVIPEYAQRYKLVELTGVRPRRRTTYSYTYRVVFGDVNQLIYDSSFRYDLPYSKNTRYKVEQGYNGRFTHQQENSIDFNMPIGTTVRAAREGIVIAVVQQFSGACLREDCKEMANYILIYHSDGTIADYSHLSYNGALVAVGDSVRKGESIALSGNTGYARGPHLHFSCYLAGFSKRRTVRTLFRVGDGSSSVILQEDKFYRKSYGR